jgi:hypothetical protein
MSTRAKQAKSKVLISESADAVRISLEAEVDALTDVLLGLRRRVITLEDRVARLQARIGPKRKTTRKVNTASCQGH